jgi:hypothetical protein
VGGGCHPLRASRRNGRRGRDRQVCRRLRATHPDYTPHGEPQALHNAGRLAWGSGPRDAAPAYTGWDVIITHDGKIAALYVFLDEICDEFRKSADKE